MAMYCGVGGVQKEIGDLYCGIGGASKQLDNIYGGVGGVGKEIYSAVPSQPLSALSVGSMLKLNETIGGVTTAEQFLVINHGYYGAEYTTLVRRYLFEPAMTFKQVAPAPANFDFSDLKSWLNYTYYYYFDQKTKDALRWVYLPNSASGLSGMCVFMLSGTELGYSSTGMEDYQDSAMAYFADSAKRVFKTRGGTSGSSWWTRSCNTDNIGNVFIVTGTGGLSTAMYTTSNLVLPAFCFSPNTKISLTTDIDGCYTLI